MFLYPSEIDVIEDEYVFFLSSINYIDSLDIFSGSMRKVRSLSDLLCHVSINFHCYVILSHWFFWYYVIIFLMANNFMFDILSFRLDHLSILFHCWINTFYFLFYK